MTSEHETESSSKASGIPVKASKPAGASIRMTRSKDSETIDPKPLEKMAEEEKKNEETPKPAAKGPMLKPKLPPKKPGGLPNLSEMKAKKPMAPLPPKKPAEEPAAEEKKPVAPQASKQGQPKPAAPQPSSEKPTEPAPEKAEEPTSKPAPKVAAKPSLEPKEGAKPKLTPKIPVKPKVNEEEKEDAKAETPAPKPSTPSSPAKPAVAAKAPEAPAAKPAPPKPHVVRPGAASAKSSPTQGGSAVAFDTSKKRSSGVSAVGVAIDVLTCAAALAVGYLILNDILKFL